MNDNTKAEVAALKKRYVGGTEKTREVTAASSTLREGLFLASSDHGVGLFADRPFVPTGSMRDVVTGYGGELGMHPHDSINTDSYRRGVGASGSNDGAHWARLIARHQTLDDPTGEQFRLQQVALPVEQRTRLLPMKWVDRRLRELIMTSGVGYMANTATDKKRHNVRIQPLRLNVITSTVYLQQRRPIQRYDEIISPYNNKEAAKRKRQAAQS